MSTFYYTTTFIDDRCSFDPEELEEYALRGRNNVIVERGQHTLMRFAVAIHGCNIELITTTYKLLSARHFMPPAVLLQTAGTIRQALCSEAGVAVDAVLAETRSTPDLYDLVLKDGAENDPYSATSAVASLLRK